MSETKKKLERIPVGVRLDPDVQRFVRINRAMTGESVTALVNRLVRREMVAQNRQPPAA